LSERGWKDARVSKTGKTWGGLASISLRKEEGDMKHERGIHKKRKKRCMEVQGHLNIKGAP